jgi:Ca2+-binding RTX toxin-like protein
MAGFNGAPLGRGSAPAGVFREIPASGFLTDGDDTLIGAWTTPFTVFAGLGDDLLVMTYSGQPFRLELDATSGYVGIYDADLGYVAFGSVSGFERVRLTGGDLNDTIRSGFDGASTLSGGAGDDLIELRGGGNLGRGGAGNDTIFGATLSDTVSGGAGTDVLFMDLSAASGPVSLRGGTAFGNWSGFEHYAGTLTAFDDTLQGGALLWDVQGGDGMDTLLLNYAALDTESPGTSISFDGTSGGYAFVSVNRPGAFADFVGVWAFERYSVTGTAQGDFLRGGGDGDRFRGQDGDDTLSGGGGRDTLIGGKGNDYLTGNLDTGSLLSGGAGDDTINVWRLDDTIAGGVGSDRLQVELWDSRDGVTIDLVAGMPGWTGIEIVNGTLSQQDDVFRTARVTGPIDASGGIDLLAFDYSRSGADRVVFRFGLLEVTQGGITGQLMLSGFDRFDLRGSSGADSLIGDELGDTLQGLAGDDWLGGRAGHDHLQGGAGRDTLFGGADDDTLDGGTGSDTLEGSIGNDVLAGGLGRDTFWFRGPNLGNDIITDFEAGLDRIVIDPVFEMVPVDQSGADVLIDILGQTLRVLNASASDVQAAIDYVDLALG